MRLTKHKGSYKSHPNKPIESLNAFGSCFAAHLERHGNQETPAENLKCNGTKVKLIIADQKLNPKVCCGISGVEVFGPPGEHKSQITPLVKVITSLTKKIAGDVKRVMNLSELKPSKFTRKKLSCKESKTQVGIIQAVGLAETESLAARKESNDFWDHLSHYLSERRVLLQELCAKMPAMKNFSCSSPAGFCKFGTGCTSPQTHLTRRQEHMVSE